MLKEDIKNFFMTKFRRDKVIPYRKLVKKENRIKKDSAFSVMKLFIFAFLVLYTVSLFGLLFWGIYTSFKNTYDFDINPWNFPSPWMWENYKTAWYELAVPVVVGAENREVGFWGLFFNSVVFSARYGAPFCSARQDMLRRVLSTKRAVLSMRSS